MELKEAIKFLCRYLDSEYYTDKCNEAHQIAISAIEKQIPKKPIHIHEEYDKHDWYKDEDGNIDEFAFEWAFHNGVVCKRCQKTYCVHCDPNYDNDKCIVNEYKCPTCSALITRSKLCENCGQVLDWSGEE